MKKNAQMIIAFVVYVSILFSSAAASNNEPLGILVYPSSGDLSLASRHGKIQVKMFIILMRTGIGFKVTFLHGMSNNPNG